MGSEGADHGGGAAAPARRSGCQVPLFDLDTLSVDQTMEALGSLGVFALRLPAEFEARNREVFELFQLFDALPEERKAAFALDTDGRPDENNGWHGPGGLSQYNKYRSGYIFQASTPIWELLGPGGGFAEAHERWRDGVMALASAVLRRVAAGLDLDGPYFDRGGPSDVCSGSQFHLKRSAFSPDATPVEADCDGRHVILPPHRDPSVISILVHNEHGGGLQVFDDATGNYFDVTDFGLGYCTVFAGSVLNRITRGAIRAAKHRVAVTAEELNCTRTAATFFFQPLLDCPLEYLEAKWISDRLEHKTPAKNEPAVVTYGEWKAAAYGKYYRRAGRGASGRRSGAAA